MADVQDTIHVNVEYFTGMEAGDDDVGHPYFVASCEEIVAITDAETWNDLLRNIREMVAASLEGEDTPTVYTLVANPRIKIAMELPADYTNLP